MGAAALPSYSVTLLCVLAAALVLVVAYATRRRWRGQPQGIQSLLAGRPRAETDIYHFYLVPLMVYEDKYSSFGRILAVVLERFPLQGFLQHEEFRSALESLGEGAFQEESPKSAAAAMCLIVRTFISDPEVSYDCRPYLQPLVNEFLEDIEDVLNR